MPAPKSSATWVRRPGLALTKRRAVDFCRVTTAICPAG
ncbi:MAG TPA: putative leader peptide [Streptosporangiaceae bacterium]|nr:putative leader peptide [Streptosporangiaceae bacterium]